MKLTAVCISTKPETLRMAIPFSCLSVNETPLERGTDEKVRRAADRRNQAMEQALQTYPETTHVLMVDSWYLNQTKELQKLIDEYPSIDGDHILGASTWCWRWPGAFHRKLEFWDSWPTPEGLEAQQTLGPFKVLTTLEGPIDGWMKVRAVGAAYIFPVSAWTKNRYDMPDSGGENVWLCRKSGLPVFMTYNVRLWHPYDRPLAKRLRVALGLRTRLASVLEKQHTIGHPLTRESDGFKWTISSSPSDGFLGYTNHEPFLKPYLFQDTDRSKGHFIDIGSHVGRWAIRASQHFSRVDAFEPAPDTFRTLLRNIEINHVGNVKPHNLALSDIRGETPFYIYAHGGWNSLYSAHLHVKAVSETKVAVARLDDYDYSPTAMKLDTEGNEYPVLVGAEETLKRHHPRLIIETHMAKDETRIPDYLTSLGYKVRPLLTPGQTYLYATS